MTKVFISPHVSQIRDDNGVGRVVHAQHKYLPETGVEIVGSAEQAEVIVGHITKGNLPAIDIIHSHGLYWTGDIGSGTYADWHHKANALIIAAAREARAITVPSEWVSMPFRRDMRLSPTVIGHGIEADEWEPRHNQGYVLWNKNRPGDACSPLPAWELAEQGIEVVSTFAPADARPLDTLRIVGTQPHAAMKEWIQAADVYLATTKETFGIGTLEALASGVPVLGYAWGGTLDLIEHGVNGWLVEPGDVEGLLAGLEEIRANRRAYSTAAMRSARKHSWQAAMAQYAALYARVAEQKRSEKRGVSVVISCYNYGVYVGDAIESCLKQRVLPDEIIVVEDGSTDNSREVIEEYEAAGKIQAIYQENQGVAAARNAGVALATQAHIVCLDADDMLEPRFIKTVLPVMQRDRTLGIAYTGLVLFHEHGQQRTGWPPEFAWESQALAHNPPSNCIPSGSMFRRDMWARVGGYQQVWAPGEDTEFWTRGLSVGFNAKRVTDEPLFLYRGHAGSASRTKPYKAIDPAHPWMRDGFYPMAAPANKLPIVRSYSQPAVSVIIPVGPGHAKYLPSALDSLLAQTCREWEAIVVNDSGESLENLAPYPFIRLLETSGGEGPGKARNVALEAARAPLALFLDADDWLQPEALHKMLQAHIASDGRYIYSGWLAINGERVVVDEPPAYSQTEWLYNGQHAVTALVPRAWCKAVGGFDEQIHGWEDWDFFVKLAVNGYCGAEVMEPLLAYRQHTGQRREKSLKQKSELLALLRERYRDYEEGKPMAGCCGGGQAGTTIMAAKRATAMPVEIDMDNETATSQALDATPVPSSHVRMEYIGTRTGAVTYNGIAGSNRTYRAGRNPANQFHNVHRDDVEKLKSTGDFAIVQRPANVTAQSAPATENGTTSHVAPPKTQEQIQAELTQEMLDIKAEAQREMERLGISPEPTAKTSKKEKPAATKQKRGRKAKNA